MSSSSRNYSGFRNALKDIQREFESAARCWPNLTHRLYSSPGKPLSAKAWEGFAEINSEKVPGASWEWWEPFPDGHSCNHFFGDERWFHVFRKLAECGMVVLEDIAFYQGRFPQHFAPREMRACLPKAKGHLGWLSLLHDTAEVATATLRTDGSEWEVPAGVSAKKADALMRASWIKFTPPPGFPKPIFPKYPTVREMPLDPFHSSVEAIRCWLFPENIVSLSDQYGQSPVCLPESTDEADGDGLAPDLPCKFVVEESCLSVEDMVQPTEPSAPAGRPLPNDQQKALDGDSSVSMIANSSVESGAREKRPLPRYDVDERVLYLGDIRIKKFTRPAENQVFILTAFEEEKWTRHIDDPLPYSGDIEPKKRLGDTLQTLNRSLEGTELRFERDGLGQGVRWKYIGER